MEDSAISLLSANNQDLINSVAKQELSVFVPASSSKQELVLSKQELAIRERLTFYRTLTSYSLPTIATELSADDVPVKGFNDDLPEITNPLILRDRNKALEKIDSILLDINKIKKEFQKAQESEPVCPYQKTLIEYLGPNFIAPSIHDLAQPKDFVVEKATNATLLISKKYNDDMLMHLQQMTAEAANTNFPGITSQHLGHAFVVLSATNTGQKYVIDKHKTALHLEFAELVRNLSTEDILTDPVSVAQKLITRYVEINQDAAQVKPFCYPAIPNPIPSIE